MVVDIPDVVTFTNFSDHRLRGFWVAGGQISPSPIDFHRRPYNTLALPCERVMVTKICVRNYVGDIDHRAKFYSNRFRVCGSAHACFRAPSEWATFFGGGV